MQPALQRWIYVLRTMSWLGDARSLCRPPEFPIDRPVFLLGTQGGGLTLLSRMLRRHPAVISAAGNHRYWTSSDELQNVYGLILPPELTGLRFKSPHDEQLPGPRSWSYAAGNVFAKYRRRACDATPQLARALQRVIRLSAWRHAPDPQRFRFVDKSQTFSVRVGLIYALLRASNPRFVLVPRDPYVSVLRAAEGKAADMKRYAASMSLSQRVEICAEHYANSMRAVLEDSHELQIDLHRLPFELLLAEPRRSLRRVCQSVGLDFRPDMLPAAGQRLPLGTRFGDRWYPLRADVNRPYAARLDAETIETVNRHCGDLVQRLGYQRRQPSQALLARAA